MRGHPSLTLILVRLGVRTVIITATINKTLETDFGWSQLNRNGCAPIDDGPTGPNVPIPFDLPFGSEPEPLNVTVYGKPGSLSTTKRGNTGKANGVKTVAVTWQNIGRQACV